MHLRITADYSRESGVGEVVTRISGPTSKRFADESYGADVEGIGVVLMCRDPNLHFKRRVRFSKATKTLYLDIMLDLPELAALDHEQRVAIVARRVQLEVPEVLAKYKFKAFDLERFRVDLRRWLAGIQLAEGPWSVA